MSDQPIRLSPRESQVLQGLVDGLASQAIAYQYNIQVGTARMYMHRAMKKSGTNNKLRLALWGIDNSQVKFEQSRGVDQFTR